MSAPQVENEESDTERLFPDEIPRSDEVPMTELNNQVEYEDDEDSTYGASHVTSILKPVTLTMVLVVIFVRALQKTVRPYYSPLMVYREVPQDDVGTKIGGSILNALIFTGTILVFTVAFFFLYKYRCMKIIYGWLGITTAMLLGFTGGYMVFELCKAFIISTDQITYVFVMWNFGIVGTIVIFWHAPGYVKQAYLVAVSVIMAWILTKLPEWTNWAILVFLALYDLFAVLAPCGPLKALVEMAQAREEQIPGLIYEADAPAREEPEEPREEQQPRSAATPSSATVATTAPTTKSPSTSSDASTAPRSESPDSATVVSGGQSVTQATRRTAPAESASAGGGVGGGGGGGGGAATAGGEFRMPIEQAIDERIYEDKGIKLGIGDFVFYSVLIGRAAAFDFVTVTACFYAILSGLCLTLFLLAAFKRALPALPFSIFLGVVLYITTNFLLLPFITRLTIESLFV